jgi:hypothetical protein
MDSDQGAVASGGQPAPAEIIELMGLWATMSDRQRHAVAAFARMIAREPKSTARRSVHLAA